MKSWNNAKQYNDSYIQWIDYSQLTNIEQTSALKFECTHTADWSQTTYRGDQLIKVMFKKIADGQNSQSFDFSQVNNRLLCTNQVSIVMRLANGCLFIIYGIDNERLSNGINSR